MLLVLNSLDLTASKEIWYYSTGAGYHRLHFKNASAKFIKATNTENSYENYLPIITTSFNQILPL